MTYALNEDQGEIRGFVVSYNDTDTINISAGFCKAKGKSYILASDTTHDMTSLASAFDHHYIYIDDDASTPPTTTIIDSTIEPTWSDSKRGWYNGDDRCIGVVPSTIGASTIIYFGTEIVGDKNIRIYFNFLDFATMAENFNPNSAMQTPTNDADELTPVNAISFKGHLIMGETGASIGSFSSAEQAASVGGYSKGYYYSRFYVDGATHMNQSSAWIPLGASRQVRLGGFDANDNVLGLLIMGYGYSR